jgi:NAD-dependent deacetylase
MKRNLVILSGAGMSQESGLKTFRDMGGLWGQYDVTEVASSDAWRKNPELVMNFYNERRKQLWESKPNIGHYGLAEFEKDFHVSIITQNVDDLHEQAGSKNVLHLHGELRKARSTIDSGLVYTLKHWELNIGDFCEKGSQLRPHIVWFGEEVPAIQDAISIVRQADFLVVIGTSLEVYPAASLVSYIKPNTQIFVIDPNSPKVYSENVIFIQKKAGNGVSVLREKLIQLNNYK